MPRSLKLSIPFWFTIENIVRISYHPHACCTSHPFEHGNSPSWLLPIPKNEVTEEVKRTIVAALKGVRERGKSDWMYLEEVLWLARMCNSRRELYWRWCAVKLSKFLALPHIGKNGSDRFSKCYCYMIFCFRQLQKQN